MEVLHSMCAANVRPKSFSCIGDYYAYIDEGSYWDYDTRSRISINMPLKSSSCCSRCNTFEVHFNGETACLLDVQYPYFKFATVVRNLINLLYLTRLEHHYELSIHTVFFWNREQRPTEMFRVSPAEFCIRTTSDKGVLYNVETFTSRTVEWNPTYRSCGSKTVYTTSASCTRQYHVEEMPETKTCVVETIELPWSESPRGSFVSACCC